MRKREKMFKKIIAFLLFLLLIAPPPAIDNNILILAQTKAGTLSLQKIVLFFTFILLISFKKLKIPLPNVFDIFLLLFSVLLLFYLPLNISQAVFFLEVIFISYLIGKYFYLHFKEDSFYLMVKVGQAAGLVQAITGIISTLYKPIFPPVPNTELFSYKPVAGIANAFRATGLTGHPITLGAFLVFGLACFLFDKKLNIIIKILSIFLILFATGMTFSRGAWFTSLLIFIFWCFSEKKIKKFVSFAILGIVAFTALYFIKPTAIDLIGERITMTSNADFSVSHRSDMISWAFNEWLKSPQSFVIGNGSSISDLFLVDPSPDILNVIDNQFLSFVVQFGLFGLFYMLMASFIIPIIGLKRIKHHNKENKFYFMATAIGIISVATYGFVFDFMFNEQLAIMFGTLLGLLSTSILKPLYLTEKLKLNSLNKGSLK